VVPQQRAITLRTHRRGVGGRRAAPRRSWCAPAAVEHAERARVVRLIGDEVQQRRATLAAVTRTHAPSPRMPHNLLSSPSRSPITRAALDACSRHTRSIESCRCGACCFQRNALSRRSSTALAAAYLWAVYDNNRIVRTTHTKCDQAQQQRHHRHQTIHFRFAAARVTMVVPGSTLCNCIATHHHSSHQFYQSVDERARQQPVDREHARRKRHRLERHLRHIRERLSERHVRARVDPVLSTDRTKRHATHDTIQ
jgi:hypothetical protein